MNYELAVLKGVERLVRQRRPAHVGVLARRAGGDEEDVRAAVGRLVRAGLVMRVGETVRLTLFGLGIAVGTVDRRTARVTGAPKLTVPVPPLRTLQMVPHRKRDAA